MKDGSGRRLTPKPKYKTLENMKPKGRPTKQVRTGRPAGKKEIMPKISGSKSEREIMPKIYGSKDKRLIPRRITPKLNDKQIQDMLTGRKPVLVNGKKPKTGPALKKAIRKKTGIMPNTAQ